MSFWGDSKQFWERKTFGNEIYARQKRELLFDIHNFGKMHNIRRVIDVGGYKGDLAHRLKDFDYRCIDIVNGFDITKDWESQGLKKLPATMCFTSLTLLCFPPEQVEFILSEMLKYSRQIYLFEEYNTSCYEHKQKISDEYGGKWAYDWARFAHHHAADFSITMSKVNKAWARVGMVK